MKTGRQAHGQAGTGEGDRQARQGHLFCHLPAIPLLLTLLTPPSPTCPSPFCLPPLPSRGTDTGFTMHVPSSPTPPFSPPPPTHTFAVPHEPAPHIPYPNLLHAALTTLHTASSMPVPQPAAFSLPPHAMCACLLLPPPTPTLPPSLACCFLMPSCAPPNSLPVPLPLAALQGQDLGGGLCGLGGDRKEGRQIRWILEGTFQTRTFSDWD